MIVKEKKYQLSDLNYNSHNNSSNSKDFIILDDKTVKINNEIEELFNIISKYNYQVDIIDINKTAFNIIDIIKEKRNDFDLIVTIGTGGQCFYNEIKNEDVIKENDVYKIKWNRIWNKEKSIGFETNINDFNFVDRRVILFEDVIASGNTLYTVIKEIEKRGGKVVYIFSSLIQESSPIISKSFCETYSSVMINKSLNSNKDPFWYPPIYSLRHLLYGDDEMTDFYKILNEKYFNNENKVEKYIKSIRKG